ncbi:class I SAM-dependent methyltransferase [Desertihabitans aurantiacus]|uniref:class I SAM-dependent methyltransferase n=1 Tax=Desertihabitans aurantiacus TaxID=2282477 RepID=UPI000DF820B0|nr:class I SAM-dependent methyltransferase [Desertihabitans aurantiacus]
MHESEDWEAYFRLHVGRPVRSDFLDALGLVDAEAPRTAIDLGAGDGTETSFLLREGWQVLAVDATAGLRARVLRTAPAESAERLSVWETTFAQIEDLRPATLIYAGMSLPFTTPAELRHTIDLITAALGPSGVFAGHFLGENDDWSTRPGVTTLTRAELLTLLDRFTVQIHRESERDAPSGLGPKHWHTHFVVATRPSE